ncbi:MAG TPA: hypothetical protein V6D22_03870 [Candidatus Obscuribacterales bacterium]
MATKHKTLLSTVTVKEGDHSDIETLTRKVIRNQKDWNKLWAQHTENSVMTVVHTPPAVDFSKLMVIAIFHGTSTSGGPKVVIDEVEEKAKSILVTYTITGKQKIDPSNPGHIGVGAAVHTHPYHIVTVKRSKKRVFFKEAE